MDFRYSADEEAFRQEIRDFLRSNPPESFPRELPDMGFGGGSWSIAFHRAMARNGWVTMTWPKEYGGQGKPLTYKLVLWEELAYHHAPFAGYTMASSMAQNIIEMGSDALKRELLPRVARGEVAFWLAMSEPDAGTDLLSLSTQAIEDGDDYVVNGQKIWSANAHLADYGFLIARTDLNVPKHKGLSSFLLDKRLPGVTVTPLTNIVGFTYHNQVFMDNVRVPKHYLLGRKNEGLFQMLKGLEHDRFWARFIKPPYCKRLLEELVQYARETRRDGRILAEEPEVRQRLAELAVDIETCRVLFQHAGWLMAKGLPLNYEASIAKVLADEMGQRLFYLGLQTMGLYGQLEVGSKWAPLAGKLEHLYLTGVGHSIAGGTSEVIRDTVATRGLGLPRGR